MDRERKGQSKAARLWLRFGADEPIHRLSLFVKVTENEVAASKGLDDVPGGHRRNQAVGRDDSEVTNPSTYKGGENVLSEEGLVVLRYRRVVANVRKPLARRSRSSRVHARSQRRAECLPTAEPSPPGDVVAQVFVPVEREYRVLVDELLHDRIHSN